jgi:Transmembrane family 220, helix
MTKYRPVRGRYLNYILTGLFVLFAALQYNDPDPWRWIAIYGYAALLCYRYASGFRPQKAALAGILFCIAYAVYLFMGTDGVFSWATEHHAENLVQTMKATKPWIENTREFGGLLIILVALGLNYSAGRKK